MASVSVSGESGAINDADQTVRTNGGASGSALLTDRSDSGDERFFCAMARGLLGKDAGFQLHLLTGNDERSCYRYASGERAVPSYMLRKLIHGEGGAPWHNAFMDTCEAGWWLQLKRDAELGRKVRALK